jgi:hypothetical protein
MAWRLPPRRTSNHLSLNRGVRVLCHQIDEPKSLGRGAAGRSGQKGTINSLADIEVDGAAEDGSVVDEGVVFAVFAAGIDAGGQLLEESAIQSAANIALFQMRVICATDDGFESPIDELPREPALE